MKSKVLQKIWLVAAAIGIGASLFVNNSHQLIESDAKTISNAIIKIK